MTANFSTSLMLLLLLPYSQLSFFLFGVAEAAATAATGQSGQTGYPGERPPAHVPILYEAYYPEPRQWSPRASLQEIERLRELTSQLLREEEQLGQLAAAAAEAGVDNALQPRSQLLEYVFTGNARPSLPVPAVRSNPIDEDAEDGQVQVASLTVSDVGPPTQHKSRHHHGQANWLLRRLANAMRP